MDIEGLCIDNCALLKLSPRRIICVETISESAINAFNNYVHLLKHHSKTVENRDPSTDYIMEREF